MSLTFRRVPQSYSDLELIILAMVATGFSTGYAIKKQLLKLHASRWSTESGSIYRALRRLQDAKLIAPISGGPTNLRRRTDYGLSKEGHEEVLRWLRDTLEPRVLDQLSDPVREKSFFLRLLPEAEQVEMVKRWGEQNKAFIRYLREEAAYLPSFRDELEQCSLLGHTLQAEARQEWLKELMTTIRKSTARMAAETVRKPGQGSRRKD